MSEAGVASGVVAVVCSAAAVYFVYQSEWVIAAGLFIAAAVAAVVAAALEG